MITKVDDLIEVLIHYSLNGAIPLLFTWQNIDYEINSINFVHTSREGSDTIVHYAVSDDRGSYKLEYNSNKTYWKIKEVYTETPHDFPTLHNVSKLKSKYKKIYR